MTQVTRLVEVRKNVLKHNDLLAGELRNRFRDAGVFVVSLVSSPGSGKTMLLERTLTLLRPRSFALAIASRRLLAISPPPMTRRALREAKRR